jgi:hypothetical protein
MSFDSDFLVELGRRASSAAAAGAETFAVPEFGPVATIIASDRRAARASETAHRWQLDGASYHALVRLCAAYVLELEAFVPACEAIYVPKVRDELEPLLALWPHVLALPAIDELSSRDFLRLRAYPVHPLGVTSATVWADGRQCSPAEFFFHDVDHARFKVREDLLARGLVLEDAYQNGTTLDPVTGRHRSILPTARDKVGPWLWLTAATRRSLFDSMLERMNGLAERPLAEAAEWLLFQILHEKSFSLDVPTLRRELAASNHVELLRTKVNKGFYEKNAPSPAVMAKLDAASRWLLELLT